MSEALQRLRQLRMEKDYLVRGSTSASSTSELNSGFAIAMCFTAFGMFAGGIGAAVYTKNLAWILAGIQWGGIVMGLWYISRPVRQWCKALLTHWRWPAVGFFAKYPRGQRFLGWLVIAWGCVYAGNHAYPKIANLWQNPVPTVVQAPQNGHKTSLRHERHKNYRR